MSTKPTPQAAGKKLERDLATFEQLPEETKALMKLKDQDEKTTGPGKVVTSRKIADQARKSRSK